VPGILTDYLGKRVIVISPNGESVTGTFTKYDSPNFTVVTDNGTTYIFSELMVTVKIKAENGQVPYR